MTRWNKILLFLIKISLLDLVWPFENSNSNEWQNCGYKCFYRKHKLTWTVLAPSHLSYCIHFICFTYDLKLNLCFLFHQTNQQQVNDSTSIFTRLVVFRRTHIKYWERSYHQHGKFKRLMSTKNYEGEWRELSE